MAKFLNSTLLKEWIPKLVNETERELVIVVPYIKTSQKMYDCLLEANKRGVETTLIYRENKLPEKEKEKFYALDNLNLMHHPHIHAKCYYNEKYLIVTSMNLYEYSEINNYEMGILLHWEDLEKTWDSSPDDEKLFKDAINEIRSIINSSSFEKQSRETIDLGFEMDIIKTDKEKVSEHCARLNKTFLNKKFEPLEVGNTYLPFCKNYFHKIDITLKGRVEISLNFEDYDLQQLFKRFNIRYNEFMIEDFKIYWNYSHQDIFLYANSKSTKWNNSSETNTFTLLKKGIDDTVRLLRELQTKN